MTPLLTQHLVRTSIPLLFVILTSAPVRAAESAPQPAQAPASPEVEAEHPLAAAILDLREATQTRLAELEARRRAAHGPDAIFAVGREIARTKLDFELGVLRLQRDEHVALGRAAVVDELSTAIDALEKLRADLVDPADETLVPSDDAAGEAPR